MTAGPMLRALRPLPKISESGIAGGADAAGFAAGLAWAKTANGAARSANTIERRIGISDLYRSVPCRMNNATLK